MQHACTKILSKISHLSLAPITLYPQAHITGPLLIYFLAPPTSSPDLHPDSSLFIYPTHHS
jgi:hypothetical protein